MSKIYFVIGVNGVGKSTLIPHLETALNNESYEVHDFDERGVPSNADREWRKTETMYWAQLGKENETKGISTIICGYSKPAEIKAAEEVIGVPIAVCLLDANPAIIRERLTNRHTDEKKVEELYRMTGKTPEKFIEDNIWVSTQFRDTSKEAGYYVLDTSDLTPEQVAQDVVVWLKC